MQIQLYTFNKRINSTLIPTGGITVNVNLKDDTSIYTPSFTLNRDPRAYTYLRWGVYYYYIDDTTHFRNGIYTISCEIDPLATWRQRIFTTSAFILYSASAFDDRIPDSRLSTVDTVVKSTNSSQLITNHASGTGEGTYIVSYATAAPTYGLSGIAYLTQTSAYNLGQQLIADGGFMTWLNEYDKQFQGAYDAILSCTYVPMTWRTQGLIPLLLGSYNSQLSAGVPPKSHSYSTTVSIPWQFSDFRNMQPYTSLILYLPAYGYLELNPNDFIDQSTISINLEIDGITAEGTYIIGNQVRCSTNFGTSVAIGTAKSGITSAIGGAIQSAYGLAMNPTGAGVVGAGAMAIDGIIASQQRSYGNVGSAGGISSVLVSQGDWWNVYITTITHNTNVEPSSVTNSIGRPLRAIRTIGSLSGYVQTQNASVSLDAPNKYISAINSYLDGGVYIE